MKYLTILVHVYYVYSSSLSDPELYAKSYRIEMECGDNTIKGLENLDDKTYFDVYERYEIPLTAMDTRVRWYQSQIDIR